MIRLEPSGPSRFDSVDLRVSRLTKRYGVVPALTDVSLHFTPGRVTAVLGPNGAGKTTLIKILLGLVRADGGAVTMDGDQVGASPEYRHRIGTMPQRPTFPENLTGREILTMLDDLRDFRGTPDEELLNAFGLQGELDRPVGDLSGGMRQKLNAALAFRYQAPVLVLDEPTASLDPVAARTLKDKVRRVRDAGATVVLTSHDLAQVEALADDVAFLSEGRLRFSGTLDDLLESTGEGDLEGAVAQLMSREGDLHSPPAVADLPSRGRPRSSQWPREALP